MNKQLGLTLFAMLYTIQVSAQTAGVFVDIGTCMNMTKNPDRYACYDRLEARVRDAWSRTGNLPVVPVPPGSQEVRQALPAEPLVSGVGEEGMERDGIAEFGREGPRMAETRVSNARILAMENGEEELVDTIKTLDQRIPDKWEVTLSSGQIWHQVNSKSYQLREGMEVRIYPSPFGGSFRLSASKVNGFIQVRRLQ